MVMLGWAATLFQYMALNIWAWMTMAEIMLQCEGYHFKTANLFHCCFSNALVHYQLLIRIIDTKVNCMADFVPIPATLLSPGVALTAEASQGMLSNLNSLSATPDSINAPAEAHITPTNPSNPNIPISLNEYTLIDERQYWKAHSSPIFSCHDLP